MKTIFFYTLLIAGIVALNGCNQAVVKDDANYQPDKVADLNTKLGVEYMRSNQYKTALNKFRKALEADSNYPTAHNMIAVLYERLGENEKARKHYEKSLSLSPRDSSTLNNFGQYLCRNGESERGQQYFIKAVENPLFQTPDVAYINAGTCALESGDKTSAETHFRNALKINPRQPRALLNMAELAYQQQQYLKTRAYLQRHRDVSKPTARTLWLGIQVENELGDKDAVASYTLLLQSQFPESDEAQKIGE